MFAFHQIQSITKKHSGKLVAFFFLTILVLGLITTPQYGHAWDDVGEMNILRMALKEYASILPFETKYKAALDEMDLPRISESAERDHGICVYYPLFWAFCRNDLAYSQLSLLWRTYTWTIFTAGLFALYACARHMGFSRMMSCIGVLIMLCSPRFFAAGHYNNKDIPLMVLTLFVLWQTARLMKAPGLSSAFGFALSAGFCSGTRVIGIPICGLCGLMVVLHLIATKRLSKKNIQIGIFTIVLSILIYILLTPSFLAAPVDFIDYTIKNAVGFSRWSGSVLLWGHTISSAFTKPPRIYLPIVIAVTTPLWMLILLACGCWSILRETFRRRSALLSSVASAYRTTIAACWVLPLFAGMAIRMMVYNGWRHLYFLYGPMVLCMLWGMQGLRNALKTSPFLQRLGAAVLAVCLLFTGAGVLLNHPYQYGYYNCLVPKQNRAALFEMDYWNLSCKDALAQLLEQTEGPVTVAAGDFRTCSGLEMAAPYFDSNRLRIVRWDDETTVPDYILSNVSYGVMEGFTPPEDQEPVVTIYSYGCPVTVIYKASDL